MFPGWKLVRPFCISSEHRSQLVVEIRSMYMQPPTSDVREDNPTSTIDNQSFIFRMLQPIHDAQQWHRALKGNLRIFWTCWRKLRYSRQGPMSLLPRPLEHPWCTPKGWTIEYSPAYILFTLLNKPIINSFISISFGCKDWHLTILHKMLATFL